MSDADGGLLPEGVSEDDVREAAKHEISLGDVAEEIGVSRRRARTITHKLGVYGDLEDVRAGGFSE